MIRRRHIVGGLGLLTAIVLMASAWLSRVPEAPDFNSVQPLLP